MLEITVNETGMEEIYLECLNRCFDRNASRKDYEWTYRRDSGASVADMLMLKKDRELMAGSAVVYRIADINGHRMKVAIMSGSWTLPAARGQGCFSRMIDESTRIAAENQAGLLLAFVTELNASFRRLKDSGAALFPTFYLEAPCGHKVDEPDGTLEVLSKDNPELEKIYDLFTAANADFSCFCYTYQQWLEQFIQRTSEITILKIDRIGYAILEESEGYSRILSLVTLDSNMYGRAISRLVNRSFALGKKVQSFTTDALLKLTYEALGFNVLKGYLTVTIANKTVLEKAFEPEHRSGVEDGFYRQDHAFALRPWMLNSGDRI